MVFVFTINCRWQKCVQCLCYMPLCVCVRTIHLQQNCSFRIWTRADTEKLIYGFYKRKANSSFFSCKPTGRWTLAISWCDSHLSLLSIVNIWRPVLLLFDHSVFDLCFALLSYHCAPCVPVCLWVMFTVTRAQTPESGLWSYHRCPFIPFRLSLDVALFHPKHCLPSSLCCFGSLLTHFCLAKILMIRKSAHTYLGSQFDWCRWPWALPFLSLSGPDKLVFFAPSLAPHSVSAMLWFHSFIWLKSKLQDTTTKNCRWKQTRWEKVQSHFSFEARSGHFSSFVWPCLAWVLCVCVDFFQIYLIFVILSIVFMRNFDQELKPERPF